MAFNSIVNLLNLHFFMKNTYVLLFSILSIHVLAAQNTFPETGRVGIGTTTPLGPLHIKSSSGNILTLQTTDDSGIYTHWRDSQGTARALIGLTNLNRLEFSLANGTNPSMYYYADLFRFFGLLTSEGEIRAYYPKGPRLGRAFSNANAYGITGCPTCKMGDGNIYLIARDLSRNGGSWISVGQRDSDTDKGDIKLVTGNNPGLGMTGKIKFITGLGLTPNVTIDENGNMAIGTESAGSWKLAVNGAMRAKEVKVETGWSDFVFEEDYALPTLEEVEKHIKEKGHLKDIPSAEEVAKNGIFLGEMDSKLLQKIEELTLYIIEQNKKLEAQQAEINELRAKIDSVEK